MKRTNSKGFTIIELLIATVIFAVIVLVVTTAIVQFGKIYYQGVLQSRTQERARAISDEISKNIQFSTGTVPTVSASGTATGTFCIGGHFYTYRMGQQVGSGAHALQVKNSPDCSGGGTEPNVELLGDRMQLKDLIISQSGDLYTVRIRVVYGANNVDFDVANNRCQPIRLGGQYCAVADMTSSVVRRL